MMAGSRDDHQHHDDPGEGHPDLVALARDELGNTDTLDAGEHLATCEACRDDLPGILVGVGLLRRSASVLPPPSTHGDHVAPALPPLQLPGARGGRGGRRVRALSLVAAAALVIGGVGGVITTRLVVDRSPRAPSAGAAPTPTYSPGPEPDRVAPLRAVGATGTGSRPTGEVQMTTGGESTAVRVFARDLPRTAAGEYYEAWLLDPATQKMLPLGVMAGTETTFRVDDALVDGYSAVDLSLESDDGDPLHSSTSVLRGSYADGAGG